jgi:hypothetical protein
LLFGALLDQIFALGAANGCADGWNPGLNLAVQTEARRCRTALRIPQSSFTRLFKIAKASSPPTAGTTSSSQVAPRPAALTAEEAGD